MPKLLKRRKVEAVIPGLDTLLSRLYVGRGIVHKKEIEHTLRNLLPPESLKGLQTASRLLATMLTTQQRILIVGDFDADGATSAALMVHALRSMGAENVDYLVPNRFEYGYGLTPEIVKVAEKRKPDLIVTVDNGISSVAGVEYAISCGIKVLVTDHHLSPEKLPPADAIVNPNQKGCEFASKNLAGVGVAFYLLSAVRQQLHSDDWFANRKQPNLADYLDLVALGTIADVVPMDYNNRVLAQEGIRRMRAGKARPGIAALLALSGTRIQTATSMDLAFGVGPRLNAAGRLEDMSLGIECLLTDDATVAEELAAHLDQLNLDRREIENDMKQQAITSLGKLQINLDEDPVGICLFEEDWHQGVVGIVAARIKDRLHRPVIAFAKVSDTEMKGSARSIHGLHIRDALDSIASRNPGLLSKFGGHAMAAGLSLHPDDYQKFAEQFDIEARRWLTEDDLKQTVISDGKLEAEFSVPLARNIMQACPWGQGFPEPLFDDQFEIIQQRIVAGKHLKLKLRKTDSAHIIDAIFFGHDQLVDSRIRQIAYRLDVNEYRGLETPQLIVECLDLQTNT